MDTSLHRNSISHEVQERHHLSVAYSRRNSGSEIYFISSRRNQHDQSSNSEDQQREQAVLNHKIWTNVHTSLVVLCLFTALGVLVICVPFLPRRKSSNEPFDPTPFICRSAILGVLAILALIVILVMVVKKEKLHDNGLVIWPRHCEHCAFVLSKIGRDDEIRSGNVPSLHQLCQTDSKTYKSPTIKSTLYITYIFSSLSICFIVLTSAIPIICILNDSGSNPASQTSPEIIAGGLLVICLVLAVYLVSFRFIPIYSDAHFIAVPKIRWAMVLLAGGAVWMAALKFVRPFAIFANGDSRMIYQCALNTTVGEFLKGVQDISQPFYVELAFMVAWQMMDMWFRFLPRKIQGIVKRIEGEHQEVSSKGKLKIQSGLVYFTNIFKSLAKKANNSTRMTLPDQDPTTVSNISHGQLDDTLDHSDNAIPTVMSQKIPERIPGSARDDRSTETSDPSLQDPGLGSTRQRYRSYRSVEMTLALSLVVSGVYFGVSNFLTGDNRSEKSLDSSFRGLYVQYFLKTLYFVPILIVIMICEKVKLKSDRSHTIHNQSSPFNPSHGSYSMLFLTLTGACLFEMTFLVASVGNLFALSTLSTDEIILNIASLFSSLFDIWRKSAEAVFLLCVQDQHQVSERETMWSLLCLLCIGIANATQWLWDSLIHEAGSALAWPVLVMFFDGNIGHVIGMLLVPFVHLYGLHTATMAFEIFKIFRYR